MMELESMMLSIPCLARGPAFTAPLAPSACTPWTLYLPQASTSQPTSHSSFNALLDTSVRVALASLCRLLVLLVSFRSQLAHQHALRARLERFVLALVEACQKFAQLVVCALTLVACGLRMIVQPVLIVPQASSRSTLTRVCRTRLSSVHQVRTACQEQRLALSMMSAPSMPATASRARSVEQTLPTRVALTIVLRVGIVLAVPSSHNQHLQAIMSRSLVRFTHRSARQALTRLGG